MKDDGSFSVDAAVAGRGLDLAVRLTPVVELLVDRVFSERVSPELVVHLVVAEGRLCRVNVADAHVQEITFLGAQVLRSAGGA